jgi:NRAMP (natural resistance-associated macrophage protein)-like metal ion transporter
MTAHTTGPRRLDNRGMIAEEHEPAHAHPAPGARERQSWLMDLGPGLVTGAADDDPSGIATYSQAGAQFGFGMLWSLLFTYPLMAGIQLISARIGRVSGHGLASNIRKHYPRWLLWGAVSLLLAANTINIGADIAAMGDALVLVAGGSGRVYIVLFGVLSVLLQVFVPYRRYSHLLKWLTLSLLAYVATVFVIHVPWREVALRTFLPHVAWSKDFLTSVVAVLGTTISPYLFFWQASQEVEELRADPHARPLKYARRGRRTQLRRIRIDTLVGMAFSNLVAYFIILTAAATLHAQGVTSIETSAQAAQALRPVAGEFAFMLFSVGIIGTGLLAVPVLAGSAAYAVAGAFRWKNSLEDKPQAAREFYAIIAASTLAGVAFSFTPINPIKALYWSAVLNGVVSVPIMVLMMLMVARHDIMGPLVASAKLKALGWVCTATMAAAVVGMLVTTFM